MAPSRWLNLCFRLAPIFVSFGAIVVALVMGGLLWSAVSPGSEPTGFTALISNATVEAHLNEYLGGTVAKADLEQRLRTFLSSGASSAAREGGNGNDVTAAIRDRLLADRRLLARRLVPVVFPA